MTMTPIIAPGTDAPDLESHHGDLNVKHSYTTTMGDVDTKGTTPARTTMQHGAETTNQASDTPDTTRRKRLSFFGRSNSDASTKEKPRPSLQTTKSNPRVVQMEPLNVQLRRPGTANGEQRRRTTDPLESIRNSLFGGKKSSGPNNAVPNVRPTSRRARHSHSIDTSGMKPANTGLIPFTSPLRPEEQRPQSRQGQEFRNEKDFYHHRKKSSISPPFNFQHVTHTSRRHLPRLDTVDEKDLPQKFGSANVRPQKTLEDIPAEAIAQDTARLVAQSGDVERPAISTTKTPQAEFGVRQSQDETRFDETRDTKFNPDSFHDQSDSGKSPVRSPKHHSSMGALNSPNPSSAAHSIHHLRNQGSFDGTSPAMRGPPRANGHQRQHSKSMMVDPTPPPETLSSAKITRLPERRPPGQPLPPVPGPPLAQAIKPPGHVVKKKLSKGSVGSRQSVTGLFPVPPSMAVKKAASVQSKLSAKSFGTSISSGSKRTDILEEPNWEDDIDFAFEQGAEAMCDFDWESLPTPLREEDEDVEQAPAPVASPPLSDQSTPDSAGSGGVRLSGWIEQPAAFGSEPSIARSVGTPDSSSDVQHKRGSSVGHRGFLAARHASSDAVPQKIPKTPPMLEVVNGSQVSASHPPTFTLTSADEAKNSPYGSSTYFPVLDSSIPEYLSDPESTRTGSSRHRKSSSYGSYDSSGRSLKTVSDTTRWSSASTSSIPDLLHSQMAKKGRRISKPLESVPHSPDCEVPPALPREECPEPMEKTIAPGARPPPSDRATSDGAIVMRRPTNPGDRTLLFQSGRVVQRGRSMLPSLRAQIQSMPADEQEGGWI